MVVKESQIVASYKEKFKECLNVFEKYQLNGEFLKNSIKEMDEFKVITPVVGGFSTGKSSMLNALIGEEILSVEITPETAIPTEITYSPNNSVEVEGKQTIEKISINDLEKLNFNVDNTKLIKIGYNNEFLKKVDKVKIVDMPGFDSGIEIHNKAINDYLPKSLAYILAFSADEPVIKESIANFLNELNIYEVPVYVVITKCDKVTPSALEEAKKFFKDNIPKRLNIKDIKIVYVEAQDDPEVKGLKDILSEIQNKADDIFKKEFSRKLKSNVNQLVSYLNSRINNSNLSVSELDEKIKTLETEIESIMEKIEKEKDKFDIQVEKCIEKIKQYVSSNLNEASQSLESMLLSGNDISDKVNVVVRTAVMTGIKSELEPRLQKYLKNIGDLMDVAILQDTNVEVDEMKLAADNMVKNIVLNSLPIVFAAIGSVVATIPAITILGGLAGPLGIIVGGAIGAFVENAFKTKRENEKRNLAREKVQGEIIPGILNQVESQIGAEIKSYVEEINQEILQDVRKQKDLMEKALNDAKKDKEEEEEKKQNELEEMKQDLLKIGSVVNGL